MLLIGKYWNKITIYWIIKDELCWCVTWTHGMLWSQIIYGHRTASFSPKMVRFYGACTAPGRRQEESYDFFINFVDIVRCPVKFMYYIKFHGARTAFAESTRVKWHRPVGICTHRTIFVTNLYRTILTVPVWASYDVWQAPWTKTNILTNRPMPVRTPDDARPGTGRCFISRTATVKSDVFLQKNIFHLHRYFISKDQKHKYK